MNSPHLRKLVTRHAQPDGVTDTPIDGLRLFRINHPIERLPGVYPPSMCCIVQGTKRAFLAGTEHLYDEDHYLCATVALPVEAEVRFASPDEPVLGLLLDLQTHVVAETLVAYEAAAGPFGTAAVSEPSSAGLVVAKADDRFRSAVLRLLELLDDPMALRVLVQGRLRELLFTIIQGGAGPHIRQAFGGSSGITRALMYLSDHLGDALSVDDLAQSAGMSRAVFHRRFKAMTGFPPLQYLKALRLNHAATLMVSGHAVRQAADAVGYASASQFSREFRRQFGQSPKGWARMAATQAPDVQATVA